jgi:DNA-binding transcriptional LysR family regulator
MSPAGCGTTCSFLKNAVGSDGERNLVRVVCVSVDTATGYVRRNLGVGVVPSFRAEPSTEGG